MFAIKSTILSLLTPITVANAPKPVFKPTHLVNHVYLMGELKDHFAKNNKPKRESKRTDKTPTLAYLKAVEEGMLQTNWGLKPADTIKSYKKDYKQIVDLCIDREQEFCNDYYVFYHGMPNSFHVFHDFLKHLHPFLEIAGKYNDFEFLRMWHEAEKKIDAHTWLTTKSYYDIKTLVFVNLSLFGNIQSPFSHSFGYFKENYKASIGVTQGLLNNLFNHYGFNTSYIQELINLNQKYVKKEGQLIQFFIPKDKVDQYVFLGNGGGGGYNSPIVSDIWDSKLNRHTKIGPILDTYIEDINSIKDFDFLQACILSSQDFLLNPKQDLKIFKYVTIKDADAQAYEKELKNICSRMFSEWISKHAHKNIDNASLGRLISFLK